MTTALLLIDIQNDYFPGGAMTLQGAEEAGARAAELLACFREERMPVYHVRHLSARPGATFFLPGTPGAEIHESVRPRQGEPVTTKHYPNAFRETELLEALRKAGIDRLVIAGMMTHMCVDASCRAAFDLGFRCTVAGDACATRDLDFSGEAVPARQVHAAFLAALNGLYAQVSTSREIVVSLSAAKG